MSEMISFDTSFSAILSRFISPLMFLSISIFFIGYSFGTGVTISSLKMSGHLPCLIELFIMSVTGLSKNPSKVSVKEIMNAVEEVMDATSCNGTSNCHNGNKCNTHNLWHELNEVVDNYLSKITINNLVESNNSPYISLREIN